MARIFVLAFVICAAVHVQYGYTVNELKPPKQLKWPSRTIKVYISSSLFASSLAIKSESDVNGAILNALQRWEEAANVEFKIALTDASSISPPGLIGDGVSLITIAPDTENMLAFSHKSQNASGLTRVFYDSRGTITEADISLNATQLFVTDKTPGAFDLEAVLTHEVGHLLGLSHSVDPSSVMFDGVPRNGNSEFPVSSRALSADDRTKIRGLYGSDRPDDNCCVKIKGQIDGSGITSRNYIIWAQDPRSGAIAEVISSRDKSFELGPLSRGSYEILAQNSSDTNVAIAAGSSTPADVQTSQPLAVPVSTRSVSFDPRLIGLNGELSRRAIGVQSGSTYRVVIAGPGLSQADLVFGTTSNGIVLDPIRSESWPGVKGWDHRAFHLTVSSWIRPGQYSLFTEDRSGARRYLVGAIAVN